MKRKKRNCVSRVYTYGLLQPTEGADIVRDQMRLGHRYKNALIEIERERRAKVNVIVSAYPEVAQLRKELESIVEDIKKTEDAIRTCRVKARKKNESVLLRARARQLRAMEIKKSYTLRAEERRIRGLPENKEPIGKINKAANGRIKRARAKCECYWGTYLLAEKSMEQIAKGRTLKFKRFRGEGSVGAQIQNGIPVDEIFNGNDKRVRITPVDPKAWESDSRSEQRRLSRTTVSVRVGSDKGKPIWATWPMIMHRPLPEGWRVKYASVVRRRIGGMYQDKLLLSLESPVDWQPECRCGTGTVGIDIGWRSSDDAGIRVAYWVDDSGDHGSFLLEKRCVDAFEMANKLQSIRDTKKNEMRDALFPMLEDLEKPEWFQEAARYIKLWKSPAKFASLAYKWSKNRFEGDGVAYDCLESWRYVDRHLWNWKRHNEDKAERRRREQYRRFAVKIAEKYGRVSMEDMDIKTLVKRKPIGEDIEWEYAKFIRDKAAIGKLREYIADACFMRGTEFVKTKTEHTTKRCHICGEINQWDDQAALYLQCGYCHSEWDQDYNAAVNLCRQGCEWSGGGGITTEKKREVAAGACTV